ncbi:peptidase C39 [Dulcicalothrix desertica PCC 7102]|uniref:Peptidase C39 n=1 Tax=Dulcicalothrix desertica PCC 7102 TaxID=232991 RepID=A0A3S1A9R1_9CYAN|nr:peptidase domain-containing ABC transporter [Dulcicalothrix desertica]RUS96246.1 peptidase C39 [Dulcicalothrix desertica PCC 7102]TWH40429.1 ATP-binding cassette subfamily B protein [Dulcicalothrix desertica PCC 7102]
MFSNQHLGELLTATLGESFSQNDLNDCLRGVEILKPPPLKRFWQAAESKPGIYIVLAGKVRLLDSDNLIATQGAGTSFGEMTLFPKEGFGVYVAKASTDLEVCYVGSDVLLPLMEKYPNIYAHLKARALSWDKRLRRQNHQQPQPLGHTSNCQTLSKRTNHSNVLPFTRASVRTSKPKQAYFPSPSLKIGHSLRRHFKRYPFYAQQSASDCGAACIAMIGRYWGKYLSVNRLREQALTNRSGTSLKNLAYSAETAGFATRPVKASLDKLAQQPLPAIAHWEGKHYVVVYEINSKQVIIADPAIGQRTLSITEFQAGWTGYALLLQPTSNLDNAELKNSFWKFFELVKPHSLVLFEVFIASVLIQVFGLITPLFTQLLLDRAIVQGSTLTLNAIGLGLVIFGLFRIALNGVRQYLLDHTANRVGVSLLVGFIKHTFRLPLEYFESRYVGDIISRVQENQKIQRFLTGEALSIILDLLTVVIYLGLMFWYSFSMALLVLLIVPPFFILAFASTSILRRVSREIFNASTEENSYLIQSLTGLRSVRSMAIEQTVRWHWEELLHKLVKKSFAAQVIGNRLSIISASIQTLITTGLLWFGALQVIHSELTIGQLVAFNMLLGNVISPFQRLSVLWNQFQEIIISTERINDVLDAQPEEDLQLFPRQPLRRLRGSIRFENVTFRYHEQSDINVLENISFEIRPEQTVAVVGRSGSGKTTLSKLILGLYPPTEGKLFIDGHDITTIALKSLREQVGVVDQDTFLFGGTIRENLCIAYPDATHEEMIETARFCGADEFISQLPMGYETQIGEGGGMLSGGQRQRLAIARAILGKPRLLLLDEATSHLDTESERIIQNNLSKIIQGRTTLIIAHRLSTVRNADLILVLDKGVLVETGTHEELIAKKGHYYYLNQQQFAQAG